MHASSKIEGAALALRAARLQRRTTARVSEAYGIADADEAYAVARVNVDLGLSRGRRISGKKVGLTSKSIQRQLGVDEPNYGFLFSDMELLDAQVLDTSGLIHPRAEGEVAFIIGRDLTDADLTWARLLRGIEYLLPAIEIVDCTIDDWKITLVDSIADNVSCANYVLGHEPRRLGDMSLAGLSMDFRRNGQTASSGTGADCMSNPLLAVYWLARKVAARGDPLKAGDVVMSGALGPMFPFQAGDRLDMEITGLGKVGINAT
jgi:2-keto-4-pentenoate hydratase